MADDGGGEAGAPAAGGSGGGGNGNAPPPQNKPFSLSFSKVARPAIAVGGKPKEEGATRELIKGVEGGRVATVAPPPSSAGPPAKRVIPKLENTFQVGLRPTAPAPDDLTTTEGRFEAAGPEEAQAAGVTYGLQARKGAKAAATAAAAAAPSGRDWEASRLREDLARLPDAAGADAYAAMPVEDFGTAMLRGMGWKGEDEGGGAGKGAAPVPRPPRLGLGATAAAPPPSRAKPGEAPLQLPDGGGGGAGAGPSAAGPPPPPPGVLAPGAAADVVAGTHAGLACTILALDDGGSSRKATVKLTASGQTVRVRVRELEVRGSRAGGRSRDERRDAKRPKRRSRSRSPPPPPPPSRPWIRPGIVVKIIDKRLAGGSLYLRRAAVVDVPAPGTATLALLPASYRGGASAGPPPPPSDLLPGVRQSQVETAVPKAEGAGVVVVGGPHAGAPGVMLQKASAGGAAAVQLASDLQVLRLTFDDFAERAPPGWGGVVGVDE